MAGTIIEDEFLDYIKLHLRILNDDDDDLIKVEIQAAISYIYENLRLIPELNDDGTANSEYPASTNDITPKSKLAIAHVVATYRTNPDDHIEVKNSVIDKRVIERILGSEMTYSKY